MRRGSLLEVGDQREEFTEPQDYRLHKPLAPFQFYTLPFLLQHTTHAQVTDAERRKKHTHQKQQQQQQKNRKEFKGSLETHQAYQYLYGTQKEKRETEWGRKFIQ